MRLRWVGDSRDYVKWDCVFENSAGRFVFYVPMLRRKADQACRHSEVQSHFDQRKDLEQFRELFPGRFGIYDPAQKEYSKSEADRYFQGVVYRIKELQKENKVLVFIDPDTGIEPTSGAKEEHLRAEDLRSVCECLRPGDKLIVYQHASRNKDWMDHLQQRAACVLKEGMKLDLYRYEDLARDVCFLVLEKPQL